MSVFINFKICDNADECSGITACPTNAIFWDGENNTVATNNDLCICCNACEIACPAGAIRVANSKEEEIQIKTDYENDPRTIQALYVDRYGASPVDQDVCILAKDIEEKINSTDSIVAIEVTKCNDAPCLINSVPISDVFGNLPYDYYKVMDDDADYEALANNYRIIELPVLFVFLKGNLIMRYDGAVDNTDPIQRTELIDAVKKALKNTKP